MGKNASDEENDFKGWKSDESKLFTDFFIKKRSFFLWFPLIGITGTFVFFGSDYKFTNESDAIDFLNVNAEILVTILAVTMSFTLLGLQFLAKSYTPRALRTYLKDIVIWGFPVLYVALITLSMFSVTIGVTFPVTTPIHPVEFIQYAFLGTFFSLVYLICFIYYVSEKIQPEKIIKDTVKTIQDDYWKVIVEDKRKFNSTKRKFKPFIILEQTLFKSIINNDIVSFEQGLGKIDVVLKKWLKPTEDKIVNKGKEIEEVDKKWWKLAEYMKKNENIDTEYSDEAKLKKLYEELYEELNKELKELYEELEFIYNFFFRNFSQLFAECKNQHREQFIIQYLKQLFGQMIWMYDKTYDKTYEHENTRIIDDFWDRLEHVGMVIFDLNMTFASDSFIKKLRELMEKEFEIIHNYDYDMIKDAHIYKVLAHDQLSMLQCFGCEAAKKKSEKLVQSIFKNLKELLLESMKISYGSRRVELSNSIMDVISKIHQKTIEKDMRYSFPDDYFKDIIENMDEGLEKQKIILNEELAKKFEEKVVRKLIKNTCNRWEKNKKDLIKKICKIIKDDVKCYMYDGIDKLIYASKYFADEYPKLASITIDAVFETYMIILKEKDSRRRREGRDKWYKKTRIDFKIIKNWIPKPLQKISNKISEIITSIDEEPFKWNKLEADDLLREIDSLKDRVHA